MSSLKLLLVALAIVMSLCMTSLAWADDLQGTGNELRQYCNQQNYAAKNERWGLCIMEVYALNRGYDWSIYALASIAEHHMVTQEQVSKITRICMPSNVTREQRALIVSKYLQNNPATLNDADVDLVITAERAAWPCSRSAH